MFANVSNARRTRARRWWCVVWILSVSSAIPIGLDVRSQAEDGAARPPNIVLLLVDDLGWMDLGCQGNARVDTPHIDRLASEGIRFTDGYSASPVCSPTRAAILTGQNPARLRITNHIPDQKRFLPDNAEWLPAEMKNELAADYETIAERLKTAGYATGFFGKWHLSGPSGRGGRGNEAVYPEAQGFDANVGGCSYGGPPTFFDPYRIHNLPPRKKGEYLPDRLIDEALGFVDRDRSKPVFLSLWFYTVHWPMEAPAPLIEKYQDRLGPGLKDARYGGMIEALDNAVGRLLDELDKRDLTDSTLVVFTSDNGAFLGVGDIRPLRLGKGYLYEGGIRVPWIIRWPGVVKPGTVSSTPIVSTDLFPTFLEAAGLEARTDVPLDGVSLVPLLRGGTLKERALHFHYPHYAWHRSNRLGSAIREGDWKLIEWLDDGSVELYNLAADLGEEKNLAPSDKGRAQSMRERLARWRESVGAGMPRRR